MGLINLVNSLSRELEEKNAELERMIRIDPLTKIYNKATIEELLKREIENAKRYKEPLSVLMIDIDDFKHINDTYGHLVGDNVLRELAHVIRKNLRKGDLAGRYGGEEFTVVLPRTDLKTAKIIAERIRRSIEDYLFPDSIHITVSIGVSQLQMESETSESLLKRADDALYTAKREGKNRVCIG